MLNKSDGSRQGEVKSSELFLVIDLAVNEIAGRALRADASHKADETHDKWPAYQGNHVLADAASVSVAPVSISSVVLEVEGLEASKKPLVPTAGSCCFL